MKDAGSLSQGLRGRPSSYPAATIPLPDLDLKGQRSLLEFLESRHCNKKINIVCLRKASGRVILRQAPSTVRAVWAHLQGSRSWRWRRPRKEQELSAFKLARGPSARWGLRTVPCLQGPRRDAPAWHPTPAPCGLALSVSSVARGS